MTIEHLDGDRVAISPEAMTDYMKAHNMKPMTKEIAETMMAEYDAGIRAGGEPHYPQEAADFLRSGMTNHQDKELSSDIVGNDGEAWPRTFDGHAWAVAFNKQFPSVAVDDALGWFCNAIMIGHDTAIWRAASPQLPVAQTVIADLERIKSSIGSFEVQDRVQKVIDALTSTRVAPVAQMSGDVFAYRAKDAHWIVCSRDEFLSQMWFMGIGGYYECAARRDDGTGIIFREREPSDLITVEQADAIFGAASHPSNAAEEARWAEIDDLFDRSGWPDRDSDAEQETTTDVERFRVAEFWSSANPGKRVLWLSVGDEIEQHECRKDFIRWVSPKPIAASPSIVPTDAQIEARSKPIDDLTRINTSMEQFHDDPTFDNARSLVAVLQEMLLTTASNAGEAKQGADK